METYTGTGISDVVKQTCDRTSQEIRNRVTELKTIIDESYFEMAGVLYNVYNKKLFIDWGHADFEEYCNAELDFSLRKAQYLISIWYYFGVQVADETVLAKVAGLGWSKVKELVNVVTPSNCDEWVEKAAKLSAIELKELTRETLSGAIASGTEEGEPAEKLHTIQFKLYDEQYKNVVDALKNAGELGKSDKPSQQLSLMALSYLSQTAATGGSERSEVIATNFKTLADSMDLDLVVIDRKTNEILLGKELITEDEPDYDDVS
jgi:hypothetical protein